MNFNSNALKARIKERFGTYHSFAATLGVSDRTLRRWLRCDTAMSADVIRRMGCLLEVPGQEIDHFFFAPREKGASSSQENMSEAEIDRALVNGVKRLTPDLMSLFMRYIECLIAMREDDADEVIHADRALQAALKAGAPLDEIAERTFALEAALGISPVLEASA